MSGRILSFPRAQVKRDSHPADRRSERILHALIKQGNGINPAPIDAHARHFHEQIWKREAGQRRPEAGSILACALDAACSEIDAAGRSMMPSMSNMGKVMYTGHSWMLE